MAVAVIVIPDALKVGAEAAVSSVYPENSGELFGVKLSADGSEPHSHWVANPIVNDSVLAGIQYLATQEPFASLAHLRVCEPWEVVAERTDLLAELGLQRVEVGE